MKRSYNIDCGLRLFACLYSLSILFAFYGVLLSFYRQCPMFNIEHYTDNNIYICWCQITKFVKMKIRVLKFL